MGFCVNCKHLGESINGKCPDFRCLSEDNALVNFITGEILYATCVEKNRFGQCLFYELFEPEEEPSEDLDNTDEELPTDEDIPDDEESNEESNEEGSITNEESVTPGAEDESETI